MATTSAAATYNHAATTFTTAAYTVSATGTATIGATSKVSIVGSSIGLNDPVTP